MGLSFRALDPATGNGAEPRKLTKARKKTTTMWKISKTIAHI